MVTLMVLYSRAMERQCGSSGVFKERSVSLVDHVIVFGQPDTKGAFH